MRKRLLEIIVCPECKEGLRLENEIVVGERVKTGTLLCEGCCKKYEVINFIPRFVASDSYVDNFSMEWTLHAKTQVDNKRSNESFETFKEKTNFSEKDIKNKLVLDVGCGSGRFSDAALRMGGEVVGIDMSYSVDAALLNLSHYENFHIVQADIFNMPFKEATFDIIFSIGVLHHSNDCKGAFDKLPVLLKNGGKIAIWLYSSHLYRGIDGIIMEIYRKIGCRLPKKILYSFCRAAAFTYPVWNNRIAYRVWHLLLPGAIFHALPRLSEDKRYDWRVLDNFDFFSPKYQSKHSYPEVYSWFKSQGLKNIELLNFEVAVKGEK